MADTPETPTTTQTEDTATPRRRAPRRTDAAKTSPTTRRAPRKSTVEKAEEAVTAAAGETGRRVRRTAAKAEGAVTSAASETVRRTRRGAAKAEEAVASAAQAVKPRSSSRAKPRHASADRKTARKGGKWRVPAIIGGLAAVGGLVAVLGRSGGGKSTTWKVSPRELGGAHQPDGTDATSSFQAKIADENTIPEATTTTHVPEATASENP